MHPDDWDSLLALIDVGDRYPGSTAIVRIRGHRGGWHLVEHRVVATPADGAIELSTVDVTARERELERTGRTERYWRTLMRNGHEAIAVLAPGELMVRDGSEALGGLLGVPVATLIGSSILDHVLAADRAALISAVGASTADGRPTGQAECRLRGPSVEPMWVEATVTDATGDPDVAGFVVNLRDVSDRKAAEARLRASESLFRTLVEHLADGAVVLDDGGIVVHASRRAHELFADGASELIGHRLPLTEIDGELRLSAAGTAGPVDVDRLPAEMTDESGRWFEVASHDLTGDPVVSGRVVIFRDITTRREAEQRWRRAANVDSLTGIPNRRGFDDQVRRLVGAGERVGIGFLDLDGFKSVNDTLGHEAGDALLTQAAARLGRVVRPNDVVGRYGGDEFVVALAGVTDEVTMMEVTARVVDAVTGRYRVFGHDVQIGVSAGWTLLAHGEDVECALRRADRRMYTQKRRGQAA
ncbi:MAG: diguanylate cyclase domain-containing protein [Acidimicrobiales bacterium]